MAEQQFTIREAIQRVVDGGFLSQEESSAVMDQIMTGQTTGAQIGALVTALRMRGETIEEIAGFASAMRSHALRVNLDLDGGPVVDTCGTGGDAAGTFNISTTASFAIAAAGVRVAKHGNRAMTSKCGSADLLACAWFSITATTPFVTLRPRKWSAWRSPSPPTLQSKTPWKKKGEFSSDCRAKRARSTTPPYCGNSAKADTWVT